MNKGCLDCKHIEWDDPDLDYVEAGFICTKRDDWVFMKTFPCKRKLKCFELREGGGGDDN